MNLGNVKGPGKIVRFSVTATGSPTGARRTSQSGEIDDFISLLFGFDRRIPNN